MITKQLNIFVVLLLLAANCFSQSYSIQGKVKEMGGGPAIGAAIIFLNPVDSTWIKGTTTNANGFYLLHDVPKGEYLLKIKSLGFKNYYRPVSLNENTDFGEISIREDATVLKQVEVKTEAVIATQSGDTTNYNSKAFKTNKDATAEDLVTKMPGVTITNGKVQAQGEDVKQVLVDGKAFFGDDANAVLKNIPAEIIDKVQVFDQKSAQSSFTGFDDGNTTKTINIVTKVQFRNGLFGKAYGGYGYQDKYRGGAVLNRFKDKQRITLLAMGNNINEQNFSSEDLLGVTSGGGGSGGPRGGGGGPSGGGGGNRGSGGGGPQSNSDNFLVNIQNGITATGAAGINYSDKWSSKVNVSGSYFFNSTQNKAVTTTLRQYIVGTNNGLNYSENNDGSNNNMNHRLNLRFDCRLDSQNSITIQPKASVQLNSGKTSLFGQNVNSDILISNTSNAFSSKLTAYTISMPLTFRHSFVKKGRTLSLDLNPSYNSSGGNNSLKINNNYYSDSLYSDTINQQSKLTKSGINTTANLVYTEPLNKTNFLSFSYTGNYTNSQSEKNTYDWSAQKLDFSLRDSLLSNVFNNQYQSHAGGAAYRYQKEKLSFSMGASYQHAELFKQQKFPGTYDLTKSFESVLPTAFFQYKFTAKNNLRINYRTNTNAPSIDQLQDVLNNTNSLQLSIGNPDLKQSYQHNLNLRYSGVNTAKSTALFILLSGTYTDNYITNSTTIAGQDMIVYDKIFLAKGSQITSQTNVNGCYNIRSFINYSFPLKKIKSNLNLNASASYNNVPAVINNKTNFSNTTNTGLGLVLSSNISEKIDFMISATPSYNYVSNTLQSSSNSVYFNQASKAKITVTPVKWLVLQVEYNNQFYQGLTGGYNQNISLLNAAVAFKFFKNQNGELRLYTFDALKQNNSIQRTTTQTYIEDTQTNILQRYYMLSFTYNFKKFYEKNQPK